MSLERLPTVPKALPDESLSSWLERISLFYGLDYAQGLGALFGVAGQFSLKEILDIDSAGELRSRLCHQTGLKMSQIPTLLNLVATDGLPGRARLAYCSDCWDDDVASGNTPYVRNRWARWSAVHCEKHSRWLNSLPAPTHFEFNSNGWSPVWQSRASWAKCFDLCFESSYENLLSGFSPSSINVPDLDWNELSLSLLELERAGARRGSGSHDLSLRRAVLDLIRTQPLDLTRGKLADRFSSVQMPPHHFLHVRSHMPMDLGARILLLLVAAELVRIVNDRKPLNIAIYEAVRDSTELAGATHSLCAGLHGGRQRKRSLVGNMGN